jgi:hypothetical protein
VADRNMLSETIIKCQIKVLRNGIFVETDIFKHNRPCYQLDKRKADFSDGTENANFKIEYFT